MFRLFKKKQDGIEIGAPVKGKAVPISEVSDPIFGEEILGKGLAFLPTEGKIYAPADGTIDLLFDTMYSVSLTGNRHLKGAALHSPQSYRRYRKERRPAYFRRPGCVKGSWH